jgi:putative peptidoglycan lipid II flippase
MKINEEDYQKLKKSNDQVAQAAFKITLAQLLGLFAGLGNQMLIAAIIGASAEMDAFLTALVIPAYFQAVLVSGLYHAFTPVFMEKILAKKEDDAWALTGTLFWLTLGILLLVAIFVSLSARGIINVTAPGLNPDKANLAAQMLVIVAFTLPITGLATLSKGIQHCRNNFFWPAIGDTVNSVGNICILVVLYRILGPLALAWGYLVSEGFRACMTVIPVLRHGWKRLVPLKDKNVISMGKLITPLVFFGIFIYCTPLFERYYASGLSDGDLSYLGYAHKISRIGVALLSEGIIMAIFPSMSRAYLEGGQQSLTQKIEYGLLITLAVSLPGLAILTAAAEPIVQLVFQRGVFQLSDTRNVSNIVSIVVIGDVIFWTLINVIQRAFYVTKDTLTAPIVSTVTAVLYFFLAKLFVRLWGYVGLAYVLPIQLAIGISILIILLKIKLMPFNILKLIQNTAIFGALSLVVYSITRVIFIYAVFLPSLIKLIITTCIGITLYLIMLNYLNRSITQSILELFGIQQVISKFKGWFHQDIQAIHEKN